MQPLHVNYQHFKNGILVFNQYYEYSFSVFSQLREMRDWLSSLVKRGQENKIKLMNGT